MQSNRFAGIYDVPEVARYLKASINGDALYQVTSSKLIRWIRQGVVSPELKDVPGHDLTIEFEDVVSLRIVLALRNAGVGWPEIKKTETWLRERTGARRPFATEYLWTGQRQIFIDWTQQLISGSRAGQMAFEILKDYLVPVHGLAFREETPRMAKSWEVRNGILLEPQIQFGAPCIKGTRIPARTLAGMVAAGDSVQWVADAFGISSDEVKAACDWEARLQSA